MIGTFFSQTFISFVGGDAMRIWRIAHHGVPMGDAARIVLYDRVFGFVGLILLIALGIPVLFQTVTDVRVHYTILALVVFAGIGCLLLLSLHRTPESWRERRLAKFASAISEMGHDILRRPRTIVALLSYSIGVQTLNVGAMYLIGRGLGAELDVQMCMVLIPPVMFLSMMPISFAGWGVREGAMVAALSTVGVAHTHSLAISIAYGIGLAIASIPGGVLWIIARRPGRGKVGTEQ